MESRENPDMAEGWVLVQFGTFRVHGSMKRVKTMNSLSKTGLGRSGHDWSQSFGPIWHVSGPEIVFWRNDIMILHHFCWRSWKITLFWPQTLIFDQKSRKYPKNPQKYQKFLGIPRDRCGGPMWRTYVELLLCPKDTTFFFKIRHRCLYAFCTKSRILCRTAATSARHQCFFSRSMIGYR